MQSKDLIFALESLEREKNISRQDTIKTIEDALVSALRKSFGKTALLSAKIDAEAGTIEAFQTLNIVEEVANPECEISLEDAKKIYDAIGDKAKKVLIVVTDSPDPVYYPVEYLKPDEGFVIQVVQNSNYNDIAIHHEMIDVDCLIEKENAIIYTYEKTLELFIMCDSNPKKLIHKFTDITGKSPMPPKWAFGFWQAGMGVLNSELAMETINQFRENDIPIDVICIDPPWQNDFCDYKWNKQTFPKPDKFIANMKRNDIHIILWLSPFVNPSCDLYETGKKNHYFLNHSQLYRYSYLNLQYLKLI